MTDTSQLAEQYFKGEKIAIEFPFPTPSILSSVNALLSKILARDGRPFLYDTIDSIILELIQNAVKANAKRHFFATNNLNINDASDYEKGMPAFKAVAFNLATMEDRLGSTPYRITVTTWHDGDQMIIQVANNITITPHERERIQLRVKTARECLNFNEAYMTAYDTSEGAGLGIIMAKLLLKNAGIDPDNLRIDYADSAVKMSLIVPPLLRSTAIESLVQKRIIEEIQSLPTFPEHVVAIQNLCRDDGVPLATIAGKVTADPALAADVLKIANSAGFITGKRVRTVNEALVIIGLKNLELILIAASSRKILDNRYRRYELIWEHCNRVSYYARRIALHYGKKAIADASAMAGILHDIGKIVLLSTDPDLASNISDVAKQHKIRSSSIIEEISIGMSHGTIGGLIAQRWNFHPELVDAITHHHSPLASEISHRDITTVIYLADQLTAIESKKLDYTFIETAVLEYLGIESLKSLKSFHALLTKEYTRTLTAGGA